MDSRIDHFKEGGTGFPTNLFPAVGAPGRVGKPAPLNYGEKKKLDLAFSTSKAGLAYA